MKSSLVFSFLLLEKVNFNIRPLLFLGYDKVDEFVDNYISKHHKIKESDLIDLLIINSIDDFMFDDGYYINTGFKFNERS